MCLCLSVYDKFEEISCKNTRDRFDKYKSMMWLMTSKCEFLKFVLQMCSQYKYNDSCRIHMIIKCQKINLVGKKSKIIDSKKQLNDK